jgi:hypothetical protein
MVATVPEAIGHRLANRRRAPPQPVSWQHDRRPAGRRLVLTNPSTSADWTTGLTSFAHQELLLAAMQDPAILDRLSNAVGAGSTIPR